MSTESEVIQIIESDPKLLALVQTLRSELDLPPKVTDVYIMRSIYGNMVEDKKGTVEVVKNRLQTYTKLISDKVDLSPDDNFKKLFGVCIYNLAKTQNPVL